MADIALRPRSATEIVDAAFQLYRRDAAQYILATGLAYAPWLLLRLVAVASKPPADGANPAAPTTLEVVATFGEILAYSIMTALIVRVGADVYHGRPLQLGPAVRQVLPRLPAVLGATLMQMVLAMIGLLFFVIPIFYVIAAFFASTQVAVLEGRGASDAMMRSARLSRGRKLHILGTLLLVFAIYFIVSLGVFLVAQIPGSQVLTTIVEALFVIVGFPLVGLTSLTLYYDARIRAEGYDVEVMTGALDPAGARS